MFREQYHIRQPQPSQLSPTNLYHPTTGRGLWQEEVGVPQSQTYHRASWGHQGMERAQTTIQIPTFPEAISPLHQEPPSYSPSFVQEPTTPPPASITNPSAAKRPRTNYTHPTPQLPPTRPPTRYTPPQGVPAASQLPTPQVVTSLPPAVAGPALQPATRPPTHTPLPRTVDW